MGCCLDLGLSHLSVVFMVALSSVVVKGVVRWPPTPGTLHIILHCLLIERSCLLSASLKRPLPNSCFAIKLAVIGHCFESNLRPVRRLKVFQAFLLEWVKSISLTISCHRSLQFLLRWSIRSAALASVDCLSSVWTNSL